MKHLKGLKAKQQDKEKFLNPFYFGPRVTRPGNLVASFDETGLLKKALAISPAQVMK